MYAVGQTEYSSTGGGGGGECRGNSLDTFLRFRAEGVLRTFPRQVFYGLQGLRYSNETEFFFFSFSSVFFLLFLFSSRESVPPNCRFVARARKKRAVLVRALKRFVSNTLLSHLNHRIVRVCVFFFFRIYIILRRDTKRYWCEIKSFPSCSLSSFPSFSRTLALSFAPWAKG